MLAALLLLALPARAERLPVRTYGAGEGLSGDLVRFIHQDSRGFLWLATNAGVSRFDGATFTNFGAADGIPFASARKIVETPEGRLYVLARERVVRWRGSRATGQTAFEPVAPPGLVSAVGDVYDLAVAPDGGVVLAGARGAARLEPDGKTLRPVDLGAPSLPEINEAEVAWTTAFDSTGALWVVRTYGITRIAPDGTVHRLPLPKERPVSSGYGWIPTMTAHRTRGVWLQAVRGIWHLTADRSGAPMVEEILDDTTGLPGLLPRAIHETQDGVLWIPTSDQGLVRCEGSPGARRFTLIGTSQGLPDREVVAVASDTQGNLWAGTGVAGVVRLAAEGLTSWGPAEGLEFPSVAAIQEDTEEGLVVTLQELRFLSLREGRIVHRWRMAPARPASWGGQQILARGADGRLWVATGVGVAMYAPGTSVRDLATQAPERLLDRRSGLGSTEVHRVFAARDGSVWIGVMHVRDGVCRVNGDGTGLHCFGPADGLPEPAEGSAFGEDAAGGLWVGLYGGGLYRFRDGRFESWPETLPEVQTAARAIRRDAAGRLWVAGAPGLLRVDGAESAKPSFRRYAAADGLSSHETFASADDRWGRVYVGGVHGLDRMDLASGTLRRFTTADGLPANRVGTMYRDSAGTLWIGTSRGLARLIPRPHRAEDPPRVFLTGVSVAGNTRDPEGPLALSSSERTLEFAFTSPSFRAAETMRFQWRLVPSSGAWSPLGTTRSIALAGLAPGRYRFEVRAVDGEGRASAPTAAAFEIEPPLWRRGWFLALSALALALIARGIYRIRVQRLLEVERVRTRIASDLHDDIGASLSQIAVLSQAASRQAARGSAEAKGSLERITDLSGNVVDAMSDVVWSINPARDRMSDLVHRMRRFAVDLFSDSDAHLQLDLPEDADDTRLDPDVRRQIYLVFKEALRNVARHSRATQVEASLRPEVSGLVLTVRDNGRGLDAAPGSSTGFGLQNMRRRAEAIGGTLGVIRREEGGTEVVLTTGPRRNLSKRMGAWLRRAP